MANYIQYTTSDGSTVLVEVESEEVSPPDGMVKAGVADTVQKTVAQAQATFEGALDRVVRQNAQALIQSVRNLAEPPNEMEVTFGLKATGEVGNIAIARGGGEANFTIRLLWAPETEQEQQDSA
jgi:Trypsin-co-occurring domain 1